MAARSKELGSAGCVAKREWSCWRSERSEAAPTWPRDSGPGSPTAPWLNSDGRMFGEWYCPGPEGKI